MPSATVENTYGGCGCAGGEVTTTRDERGRRKRYTKDVLGRLARVEELNWDTSVYATTHYSYNGRDQLTGINQSGLWRGFGYDGHGRVSWRSTPEQGATHYGYNTDDTLAWVSDARGATASYTYNQRHLVTNITYGVVAGSSVTPTSNVRFEYDAAGNRTARYNGVELRQYAYDQMSRLKHEDINFPGMDANWRRISYGYNLAGQLTRVTNPWGAEVAYAHDSEGQLTGVTGANYANVGTYASNLRYRAFGGMKAMSYGNGKQLTVGYDERLRVKGWDVAGVLGWDYRYDKFDEKSQRVTYAQNIYDPTLSRSYDYDHVGRLRYAHTGVEARMHAFNQAHDGGAYGPYSQHTYQDEWGNPTQRYGWGGVNASDTATYDARNRRVGLTYDEAGNVTEDGQPHAYDAEGQETYASIGNLSQAYDGERLRVKKVEQGYATYYLRSSVLGGWVIAEMDWQGVWQRG